MFAAMHGGDLALRVRVQLHHVPAKLRALDHLLLRVRQRRLFLHAELRGEFRLQV